MIKNKKLKIIGWVIFGIFICWLCFYVPSKDKDQQREVIEDFYNAIYTYDYETGDKDCSSNIKCEHTLTTLKPYLSKNTLIDLETIDSLVVRPAVFSQVDVSLWDLNSIKSNGEYRLDGKKVYQFDVTVTVVSESLTTEESNTHNLNMYIQLVSEKDGWKVHSLEYFSNDLIFE
ncbi:MAG TPA: hypothetical protein DCY20_08195 [Firmicutes bacterium]|nr:hypothetical protein [Bacillota bacterium]